MTGEAHPVFDEKSGRAAKPGAPEVSGRLPLAVRRHRLVAEIDRRLRTRCGLPAAAPLVLGVSGGADSVALMLACVVLRDRAAGKRVGRKPIVEPIVVHVNHHLREEADADAEFVAELCRASSLPFHLEHVRPWEAGGNLEAAARDMRYEALKRSALKVGAGCVAVGHHGEDQLETMLIALCRGAGLEGLSGMAWSRPLDERVRLIRPMLAARKCDCEDLCRAAGIMWREDPTNRDIDQARARLRREVLPALEALWPDAPRRASSTGDLLAVARQALSERIEEAFGAAANRGWGRARLAGLPLPVVAAGLRRAAVDEVPDISDELGQRQLLSAAEHITCDDRRPKRFDWPGGLILHVTSRQVELLRCAGGNGNDEDGS
ncbi:MAG: tRNA lysidine(34) synthetase TilS [Phycisphaerales bacterium]|nr:MAG: tRNA lysidine(34) synthetase TilS [Phycisphaerales bacterium]